MAEMLSPEDRASLVVAAQNPSDPLRFVHEQVVKHIRAAVQAEREACAKVAETHKGSAAKKRHEMKLGPLDSQIKAEIIAEERGEDIAAGMIAAAIRERGEGCQTKVSDTEETPPSG